MAEILHRQKTEHTAEEMAAGDDSSAGTKEIYEAVYRDVMEEVRRNLSQMKPQLVQEIADAVFARMEEKYGKRLESGLEKPEGKATEKNGRSGKGKEPRAGAERTKKIDVSEIHGGYRVGGWIYYANYDDGGFLYKVRKDGSGNTQLTDYAVFDSTITSAGGYLYYKDKRTYTERKIKLED